ncbi:MAG TPA: bifunctional phosphoribosylaminoimidazolecarboxamide formyltransferase/IMP cyclohydrolase [Caldithrix sp.]|nr:bifunctional phosphoribosylaminoimidazolecarboxamide formyltransferase/IMP cyclohydrolase [Caldithrix sp.]
MDKIKIKRVLISVSDKSGIESLAKTLHQIGCEIISTGGTKKVLESAGLPVTEISKVTGNPEAFGGRMKTISFQIESALLFDREKDAKEAASLNIEPIDMVICNLYPFERVKKQGADFDTLIENIDIGGPTMVRAAAKNFKYVAIVTNPRTYPDIVEELKANDGSLSYHTRFELMRAAYNATADYDAMIATTMDETAGVLSQRMSYSQAIELRYGENSHQSAFFLKQNGTSDSLYDMNVLHGKELSFNNLVDMYSAIDSVRDLKKSGCAVIKHNNPCGLSEGADQRKVFEQAWAGDPVSAFGSVIAFNRKLELETAKFLDLDNENKMLRKFVEVIIAPEFDQNTLDYLFQNKNLRVVEFDPARLTTDKDVKFLYNSILVQNPDDKLKDKAETVTQAQMKVDDNLLDFGLIACRQLKSNSIAIVRKLKNGDNQLLGMGCGQPNRVNSTQLAISRSIENLKLEFTGSESEVNAYIQQEMGEAILVSDAFFPFPDNIELAGAAGIKKIFQPGGSIRDKSVIAKCDELGIAMMFTGLRHFKH